MEFCISLPLTITSVWLAVPASLGVRYNSAVSPYSIGQAISRYEAEIAKVAELVDALDLGSSAARRESSSLSFRTITGVQ